jgi:hypothetical protein
LWRGDTGVDRARLRFVGGLPVVGSLPVGAGSLDLSGEIWRLGFLLALFELRWP